MPNASTPAQYVLILIDLMEGRGCPSDELLAGTTLAQASMSGIGARIRNTDFNRLVTNAQNLTGDPALGLQLGLRHFTPQIEPQLTLEHYLTNCGLKRCMVDR